MALCKKPYHHGLLRSIVILSVIIWTNRIGSTVSAFNGCSSSRSSGINHSTNGIVGLVHSSSSNISSRTPVPVLGRKKHDSFLPLLPEQKKKSRIQVVLQSQASDGNEEKGEEESESFRWIGTLILPLWLCYVSNQWSRSSLYYLVDFSTKATPKLAMNIDVGFTEEQYGVLASLAFTSLFAIASFGAGIIADRYDRKTLTIASCVVWSTATFGTSLASEYNEVLVWRIVMGLACAFTTSSAYTLIPQLVPNKDRVSLATSLYGTGVATGGALAALSILLDDTLGWRQAMTSIALFGVGSAAIALFVLPMDPKNQQQQQQKQQDNTSDSNGATANKFIAKLFPSSNDDDRKDTTRTTTIVTTEDDNKNTILSDVAEVISTARIKWLFLASFLRFSSGLCIGVWSAPFYRTVFFDRVSEYAVAQALITAVGGSVSGILGGFLADYVSSSSSSEEGKEECDDPIGRRLWISVIGSGLAVPAFYLAVQTDQSFEAAMAWLAVEYLVAECWFGPTISALQATVGTKIGGTAQGMFTLTGALANTAPSVLGFYYGQISSSSSAAADAAAAAATTTTSLSNLLAAVVCFGYLSSSFCFAMSARATPPPPSATLPSSPPVGRK